MLSLRRSCSSGSTRPGRPGPSTSAHTPTIRRIYEHGAGSSGCRLHRRHDRPVRAVVRWPPLVARIKDTSVEAVKAGRRLRRRRRGRTPLRKAGARLVGRCPFHEERTPQLLGQPVDRLYYCFGCGTRAATDHVRARDAGARLRRRDRVARRPLPHPARVRGELAGAGREAHAPRSGCCELLDQAAAFYERTLWETRGGLRSRATT